MSEPKLNIKEETSTKKDPFTPEKSQGGAVGAQKEEAENRCGKRPPKKPSICGSARRS